MLDLHLLCSRVPRHSADAQRAVLGDAGGGPGFAFVWVVEVLLDEVGVWEAEPGMVDGGGGGGSWTQRRDREQRWAAVEVVDGVVVRDAFPKEGGEEVPVVKEVRLAGGFGGRRV